MRKWIRPVSLIFILLAFAFVLPGQATARAVYPDVIPLADGYQPEGITLGNGHTAYTGSLNGGAIFSLDLRSGEVAMLAAPGNRMAVGNDFDSRSGYLFVAGGLLGQAYVFDTSTGELIHQYQLTNSQNTFINDVIVTQKAAYFTDSFQGQYYVLPLGSNGSLPDPAAVLTIPLSGDFVNIPGAFNANGIEATPDGKTLIIVNSGLGSLYRVDPDSGVASLIDLGGDNVANGDGILLHGQTLYVVQNVMNQIAVVELDSSLSSGQVTGALTNPNFRVPTTIAKFGSALYAVNARFDQVPAGGAQPGDSFEAVRVPLR